MNCHEARQHLMLYLDSEGDPELHFRISDHLAMCPACAEWFRRQQRLDRALNERLAAAPATPELWDRVLNRAGLTRPAARRRRFLMAGMLAAAVVFVTVPGVVYLVGRSQASELEHLAIDWHERLLHGDVQPDLVSRSDEEVDHYLKKKLPFRVHCPPRTDVNFAVRGAGVCQVKETQQAAYIVGEVDRAPVSILVLDQASLAAFPRERARLEGGQRHRCREGPYRMIAAIVADNVVFIIGTASPDDLEKLLNAYGSYHGG